jgi:hypothetical protein
MNKLSLVGMQIPEKYKENFDVSSEGPSSGITGAFALNVEILLNIIFQVVASLPTKAQALKYLFQGRLTKCPVTLSLGRTYVQ